MKSTKRAFIATAEPFDDEMKARIEKHKKERDLTFETFEEPIYLSKVLKLTADYEVCVIDCMTTWLGNMIYHGIEIESEIENFILNLNGNEIIVSNEVGMGVISVDKATRSYVENLGRLNQRIARISDEVFFMIAGIPLKVK